MIALLLALATPALLPNPTITPGATRHVTRATLCQPGTARDARHVTAATKRRVFEAYALTPNGRSFEVDHLIPLELGGSNDLANLWPQSYLTQPYNAAVKDRLENRLHALVCAGALPLTTAQRALSEDWISAFQRYIGTPDTTE